MAIFEPEHDMCISIHALLAESDTRVMSSAVWNIISIHALLAESDGQSSSFIAYLEISIHALLAESDQHKCGDRNTDVNFYPRSPCGERRGAVVHTPHWYGNFYPRSPCGERRAENLNNRLTIKPISIHALLAESDNATH